MAGRCSLFLLPLLFFFFFFLVSLVDGRAQLGGQKRYKGYGDPQFVGGVDHQHSVGSLTGEAYYGTQATISLWNPFVEHQESEFSLAQLWVLNRDNSLCNSLCSLEAGWQVYPAKYGDSNPHLFVYWTRDNYNRTEGCYNLDCPGFVQTSQNYVPGETVLSPVSTLDGSQYEITLHVFRDSGTGNWMLYANGEQVGYWPQNLSYLTANYATELEWGGEIINGDQNGPHTATQMGSGQFAEAGYKKAAYIRNLQWVDVQNNLQNVDTSNLKMYAEDSTCYDITRASNDNNWGTYFFFGGPGRNSNCP